MPRNSDGSQLLDLADKSPQLPNSECGLAAGTALKKAVIALVRALQREQDVDSCEHLVLREEQQNALTVFLRRNAGCSDREHTDGFVWRSRICDLKSVPLG